MKHDNPIPPAGTVVIPTSDVSRDGSSDRSVATRDHRVIQDWAARHKAEPATGEATASGPATIHVNDGGAGVRFNFPGVARFRPISWEEWFENFEGHRLVFVFEEEVADRAYDLWQGRGGSHGHDQDDWLEAERQIGRPRGRYRFVPAPPAEQV
ncbi:MAG TPA: DUF2934 domain-containing protein [Vicinamibacterales bacterium]|jgi:hypothetical protein